MDQEVQEEQVDRESEAALALRFVVVAAVVVAAAVAAAVVVVAAATNVHCVTHQGQ